MLLTKTLVLQIILNVILKMYGYDFSGLKKWCKHNRWILMTDYVV